MVAQSQLAAVDFNQIQNLEQVKTKDGLSHANVCFSKMTKTWAVKPIKEAKVLIFFSSLIDQTVEAFLKKERFDCSLENILKNIASIPKPDKIDAIANYRSRFSS